MKNKFPLFLCLAAPAMAQPVSIGVEGGVPITDAFQTFRGNSAFYATNTKRYEVGPALQVHFPARLTLEVDGLYKRLGYQYQQSSPTVITRSTVANSWEFPVLIKYDVLPGPLRPFVGAGGAFRHISGIDEVQHAIDAAGNVVDVTLDNAPEFNRRNDIGLVLGGGVTFKLGRVRISPEFRYTRWGSEAFRDPVNALLRSSRNQGDFLVGVTF
ncbi:MAG TPA: porin family protein [Bryobacteraceae bacterium]|nr:porin family protein [Bryobacteraceae bacterium]